ncbi:MAG: hypothetical protein JWO06_3355 [Bacteroidota bacterium]|nr:hypothetical protein [Bacteroidota bacterium]
MKANFFKVLTGTCLIVLAFSFTASAQNFDNIAASFKAGDASGLAKHFEGNVEITIKNAGTSYSKSQAEMVLKSFFTSHQPKTFAIAHQGTSPEGSKYFIGNMSTSTGNYRTYVYAKATNGNLVIQEIRFEEQ